MTKIRLIVTTEMLADVYDVTPDTTGEEIMAWIREAKYQMEGLLPAEADA
jgi:hypothetical protein